MEMYQLLLVIFGALTLFGSGASVAMTCVIKFNDLHHMGLKVDAMDKKLDENIKKTNETHEGLTGMQKVCDERHIKTVVRKRK